MSCKTSRKVHRSGFTPLELIVVIAILGILIALLLPAIQSARSQARRGTCLLRMKQLVLPFHAMPRFPPSCRVKRDPTGEIIWMDGWSWSVDVLPYIERVGLYERLDTHAGEPLAHYTDMKHPHTLAVGTLIPEFLCPEFAGRPFLGEGPKMEAITNYKAMGGSHIESLLVASENPPKKLLYGDRTDHPDAGIYPGSRLSPKDFARDGTAHTILLVETTEQYRARWAVGREANLVGLPASEVGLTFDKEFGYYHPAGYLPHRWRTESTLPAKVARTYLDWDYAEHSYNDGGVSDGGHGPSVWLDISAPFFGPGSHHRSGVNHAFADASANVISRSIDAAAYFFMMTRKNADPFPPHEAWAD